VAVPRGAYVTAAMLGAGARNGPRPLRPGERALELPVAGGGALAVAEPGARVDVVVTGGSADGGGRSLVALQDVELLAVGAARETPTAADGDAAAASTALATLRVTARQAVYLTAAANFATEVRLLVRPPGDRKAVGRVTGFGWPEDRR
jgi:pilus assembly protein CpaB